MLIGTIKNPALLPHFLLHFVPSNILPTEWFQNLKASLNLKKLSDDPAAKKFTIKKRQLSTLNAE